MDIIVGFIILAVILFVVGLMAFGLWGIWWFATADRRAERQAAEATTDLAEKFDGDTRLVTYEVSTLRAHPTQAEVIQAADAADYQLTSTTPGRWGATLVFQKRAED